MGDPAYSSPFEAECRAYFILCTLDNGRGMDVLKYVKNLPQYILESRHVKFAMRVFVARHTGDYYQFFSLLRQATYLQSCLMFRYIPSARSSALLRMNRAYRGQLYPLEDLVELLCFDDMEHAYSVCKHHKLRISGRPGAGDDSAVVVKFGGDFETDIQLRRNNDPLAVCASKIYVGMKQGNYLRRDICRGVTEHPSKEYPGLSKLIQDFEQSERAKLYPNRPPYEDAYSYFVDYREGQSAVPPTTAAPTHTKSTGFGSELTVGQQSAETEQRRQDLELIAKKKLELEKKQQEVKQRIQELQRAKEEKARQEQAKVEAIARARAEKEAEEAKQQQLQLEKQLQEQRKQRELAEQRKRAEEEARKAEQERLAAIQRAEALKAKAAEEERRLQEEKRQEELRRKAAEELERRRQQELAEARARKERHRVALVVLAFGSAEIESSYSELLTSLEGCVRRLESRYASSLTQIGFELIGAKDSLPTKFALALTNAAALSPPVRLFKSVGLKELLETSLKAMMNQYQSSVSIQSMICAVFPRVRQDILSSGVMDFVYLPPELLHVGLEPLPGWNSQEKRHEIRTVLTALEVTRVTVESKQLAVKREHICDVYFNNIVDFVDRLFHSYPAATAVSTYELKKRIYSSLLPVHQQLMNGGVEDQVTLQETDSLLPWRKIFEEVYTAFFETVNDITIYYPADWQGSIPSTFGLLDAPLPSRLAAPLVVNRSIKRDYSKMKQPVKVSLKSFKKSFGSKAPNVVDESLRKYRAVGEMKRLRVEIDRERAATSQFQRMLRKELKRWNTDDGPP
ncbi:hypothetical protein PHYBOEH_008516 [Phytophthora boehmeriae]|uniref:SAC3/GANP/THP3 conserved domain-containing protein n=1 Tax=Phytophthora boehmeriae TaxID=109152 RepID=A0A8T1X7L0_9STRA|nr:hypothetical protein PHYBOEH_008516 [Phytophthora boehmeriae]